VLTGFEKQQTFVMETTLLIVPDALTRSETVDPELGVPPLVFPALRSEERPLTDVVEGETAIRSRERIDVLVDAGFDGVVNVA
jgi:hypothetical protein